MAYNSTNRTIAKNTMSLYIRMILIMAVTLYTSRVILEVLGVEDFGLYNVVGGIVVLFTFINNAMVNSTQRFLNFELGKNDESNASKVFSSSVIIHLGISIFILFLGETIGLWFLNNYIAIPSGREFAANICFQFTILTTVANIVKAPYNAAIIAYEKMSFYAYFSIIEVLLRLGMVFLLKIYGHDKLIVYSFMMFLVSCIITFIYYFYCRRSFEITKLVLNKDRKLYHELINFSGWSLFGSMADIFSIQGISFLFNMFSGGVIFNAAMGVGQQVVSAVSALVSNFQTAFRPQIVKSYANGDVDAFLNLVFRSSRFSFFLLLIMVVPFWISSRFLLELWLDSVPDYSIEFSRILLSCLLVDAMSAPLWISAQAIGNIKNYQIIISVNILIILPIVYICLLFGLSPVWALISKILVNLSCHFTRLFYLHKRILFPVKAFIKEVMAPILLVIFLLLPLCILINMIGTGGWYEIIKMTISFCLVVTTIYFVGLTSSERDLLKNILNKIIVKFCEKRDRI